MGDSWRFDPNKDYTNDEEDNGRGFTKFKHKKNRNNSYDYEDNYKKSRRGKNRPNRNWR